MLDYDLHPSFKSSQNPYEVSKASIDKINQLILKNQLGQSKIEVSKLFGHMMKEADEYEKMFLSELEEKTQSLMEELIANRQINNSDENLLKNSKFLIENLRKSTIERINLLAKKDIESIRKKIAQGARTREEKTISNGKDLLKIVRILNKEFHRNGVLDIVSDFMGFSYQVGGAALEVSVPNNLWWQNAQEGIDRPPETLYAHLDESLKNPKAIVYLSDVGVKNGPTSYYPGIYEAMNLSALQEIIGRAIGTGIGSLNNKLNSYYKSKYYQTTGSIKFREHFMRLPPELRFNSHFGWDVIPNSPLEKNMVESERFLISDKGAYIVFDGSRLVHRGGLITEGERIVLQLIFTPKIKISKKFLNLFERLKS